MQGQAQGLRRGLASARDRARLRERELAERARVERVLARGPREARRADVDLVPTGATGAPGATGASCPCRVCGGREVVEDEVFDRGVWRVARCLRCEHRSMERIAVRFKPAVRRPAAAWERRANGA